MTPIRFRLYNHTKGPFENDNTAKVYSKHVIRHNGLIVATLPSDGSMMPLEQKEANASLIARFDEVPHDCVDPQCPGSINQAKIAAFDKLQTALNGVIYLQVADHKED